MARKGENIRKRKDGRWEGRYKSGYKSDGSTKYSSVYGKSYAEVKNKLLHIKQDTTCFDHNPHTEKKFDEVLFLWLKSNQIKIKGATESKYRYMIERHIIPQLGNKRISSISTPMINNFLYEKTDNGRLDGKGGLSASYVKTMAVIIESAMKFAYNEGFCAPLKSQVLKPSSTKNNVPILSLAAQQQFEKMTASDVDETKTGIYIALYAGLRIGEICALAWDDVDFDSQIIHVRHTVTRVHHNQNDSTSSSLIIDVPKTKASIRDIPIAQMLLPILNYMKAQSSSKYVISTQTNFVSTRTFDYRYKKVFRDLGIPEINFHALRHTFATRCIEVGMDVKSLSQMLGHSNVSITLNTYVHPSMDTMRTQMQKLCTLSAM